MVLCTVTFNLYCRIVFVWLRASSLSYLPSWAMDHFQENVTREDYGEVQERLEEMRTSKHPHLFETDKVSKSWP